MEPTASDISATDSTMSPANTGAETSAAISTTSPPSSVVNCPGPTFISQVAYNTEAKNIYVAELTLAYNGTGTTQFESIPVIESTNFPTSAWNMTNALTACMSYMAGQQTVPADNANATYPEITFGLDTVNEDYVCILFDDDNAGAKAYGDANATIGCVLGYQEESYFKLFG
ncbi:hypothetical protein ANO11243_042090 [Dothideomycetidae sp. 11243]|nr:hypothetical protein ANO11243_042090 [fungal sp. No.11243]